LGFLDVETRLEPEKQLRNVCGRLAIGDAEACGYEIHAGVTRGPALARPAVVLETHSDGALSADGQVLGTYMHGLFDAEEARASLLRWVGLQGQQHTDFRASRQAAIDRLADAVQDHLDVENVLRILDGKTSKS
jgi:adenosylcobyric acid synthase